MKDRLPCIPCPDIRPASSTRPNIGKFSELPTFRKIGKYPRNKQYPCKQSTASTERAMA